MIVRAVPAILCALAAATLYGTVPNFTRAAFQNGVPAVETTFLRTSVIAVAFAIAGRSISRHFTPEVFGCLVHALIWPATLLVALWVGGGKLAILPGGAATSTGLAFAAALGALYVIAYFVQMLSLRWAPASTVAPFFNLEPVVTVALATVLLGERLGPVQYAGAALVLAALVVSGWLGMRKGSAP